MKHRQHSTHRQRFTEHNYNTRFESCPWDANAMVSVEKQPPNPSTDPMIWSTELITPKS
jgi:hypothetical protein